MSLSGGYIGVAAAYCFSSSPRQHRIEYNGWVYDNVDEMIREADGLMDAGNYGAAVKLYDKTLEYRRDARIYRKLATALYRSGQVRDAIELYKRSLKLNPQDSELRQWLLNAGEKGGEL